MFHCGFNHHSYDQREEQELWNFALHRDRNIARAIDQGKMASLLPGAPRDAFLPLGAVPSKSAQVQVHAQGDIHPKVLHLTTQPTGYISPLSSLSAEGREILNSPYQAAMEAVSRARAGPIAWADRLTLETLQSGGLSSNFKPSSVLNLPYMEKKVD